MGLSRALAPLLVALLAAQLALGARQAPQDALALGGEGGGDDTSALVAAAADAAAEAGAELLSVGGNEEWVRPWFCHGLDCPKYEVVNTTDAYETRVYDKGEREGGVCSGGVGVHACTHAGTPQLPPPPPRLLPPQPPPPTVPLLQACGCPLTSPPLPTPLPPRLGSW